MEETTRAFALLAAVALALSPVTHGVLEEAARTADRVILEPADWDREPPEDPPEGEPPEDIPEGNESYDLPAGAAPSCEVETESAAGWNHPSGPEEQSPPSNRTNDLTRPTDSFEVNDTHVGIGVALQVENLTGDLDATLRDPDGSVEFDYSHRAFSGQQTDVNRTSTIPWEDLSEGTWEAELSYQTAYYDRLAFVIVTASCAGDDA